MDYDHCCERQIFFESFKLGRIRESMNHADKNKLRARKRVHIYIQSKCIKTHAHKSKAVKDTYTQIPAKQKNIPVRPYIFVILLLQKLICQFLHKVLVKIQNL